MQPEEEPAGALADYSHLPTDALGVVLQHLFAPSPVNGAALPLSEFLARWRAIRLTCRHWSSVSSQGSHRVCPCSEALASTLWSHEIARPVVALPPPALLPPTAAAAPPPPALTQVLVATPPPLFLGVSTLPEAWLPWLASLPVNTLRIQLGLDEVGGWGRGG
jgi:hypothetical protein